MTETAQLALIGVLGAFLTGFLGVVTAYLNLLMNKAKDAAVASRTAATASSNAATAAKALQTTLDDNTSITSQIRDLVNGERTAMLAALARKNEEIKSLVAQNAALKAAQLQKGVSQ